MKDEFLEHNMVIYITAINFRVKYVFGQLTFSEFWN